MGQKINPISLRIQSSTRYFDQAWYSDYFFPQLISIDLVIFQYLNNFLKSLKLPLGRFSLYHLPKSTKLYTFFCYPKQSRDSKSKIFHISSGLPNLKVKKYTSSGKNQRKSIRAQKNSGLLDNFLFPTITGKKIEKNSYFLNFLFYSILKSKLYSQTVFLNNLKNNFQQKKLLYFSSPLLCSTKSTTVPLISLQTTHVPFYVETLSKTQNLHQNSKNIQKLFRISENNDIVTPYLMNLLAHNPKTSLKKSIVNQEKNLQVFLYILKIFKILKTPYTFSLSNKILQGIFQYDDFCFDFQSKYSNTSFQKKALVFKEPLKYNRYLQQNLSSFFKFDITSIPFQVNYEWQDAGYFADEIVFLLERRISFRQIKNKLLKQLSLNSTIRGVRITCSGRVGGKSKKAQRAKTDSIKYGQTSLNVFSSQIDFAVRTASTALGSTGVKVWVCYK